MASAYLKLASSWNNVLLRNNAIVSVRTIVTQAAANQEMPVSKNEPRRTVFISQSQDIITNLALEDWLYRKYNFNQQRILMMWKNKPCVVIGRHQNPWLESNSSFLADTGIMLARRNSGGGAVYHDLGNLNLTFFMPRSLYKRKYNLMVICRALQKNWGLDVEISKREDLILDGKYKISGTAAKLGKDNAYHHCTILVDSNPEQLQQALHRENLQVESRATVSIPSEVKNLAEVDPSITVDAVLTAIGYEFLRSSAKGEELQGEGLVQQRGFTKINPSDEWFPGLDDLSQEFGSWSWRFGKTPKFVATQSFYVPSELTGVERCELTVKMQVMHGTIDEVIVSFPPALVDYFKSRDLQDFFSHLKGRRFSTSEITDIENQMFPGDDKDPQHFVADCLKKVVRSL